MQRFSVLRIVVVLLLVSFSSIAQISYTFNASNGSFNALPGGATTIFGANVDDAISPPIAIGFPFLYGCVKYDTMQVSTNGFIYLTTTSNTITNSYPNNDLTNVTNRPIIAPLWDDLLTSPSGGRVAYRRTGSPGSRVLTIEWKTMRWDKNATASAVSFQVKLYEGTNKIEFVYNVLAGNVNNGSASIGLAGPVVGDFYSVDTLALSAAVSKTIETTNIENKPTSGLTFEFGPQCANIDGGVSAILSPQSTGCYANNENVIVSINNYGSVDISNFLVNVKISGANSQNLLATYTGTITAGSSATMNVGVANMSASGTYYFKAYTSIVGDINFNNDTTYATYYKPPTFPLPQYVDFTNYDGTNLSALFNGWYEGQGGSIPTGTVSQWDYAIGLDGPTNFTAKVNLLSTVKNEWIIGPIVVPTNSTILSFDAAVTDVNNVFAPATMGSDDGLYVMISTDCGLSYTPIFTISASNNLPNTLTNFTVSLASYSNTPVIVAFYATDGTVADPNNYDLHIDNINLYNLYPTDIGALSIMQPTNYDNCFFTETFIVKVKNYGSNTVTSNTVGVVIQGPNSGTLTATIPSITSLNTATANLGSFNMSPAGTYTIKLFAKTPGDMNIGNDTIKYIYTSAKLPYPTLETFDTSPPFGLPLYWQNDKLSDANSFYTRVTDLVYEHGAGNPPTRGLCSNMYIYATKTWFKTPVIGPIGSNAAVSFLYRITDNIDYINPGGLATNYSSNDSIKVYVSNNCGNTWNLIGYINGSKHNKTTSFQKAQFCIGSSYTGQYVRIKIEAKWGSGDYWIDIDSVRVGTFSTPYVFVTQNPLCAGLTTTLIASGGDTYSWNTGATTSSIVVSPSVNTTYSVQVSTTNGCNGSNTVSISVYSQPTIALTVSSSTLCQGNSVMLSQTGLTNFTWTNGSTSYTYDPVTYTPTATQSYTVYGYDNNGCLGQSVTTISVYPNPTITTSASSSTVCAQTTVTLSASGAINYTWTTPTSTVSTNPYVYIPIAASPGIQTYTVMGTNSFGCASINQQTVFVYPAPNLNISASSNAICNGSSATLAVSGANSYTWTSPSGNSYTNVIVVSPSVSTTYTVSGVNSYGCMGENQFNLSVVPQPTVSISLPSNTVCSGQTFTMSASGATTYSWVGSNGTYYAGSVVSTSLNANTNFTVTGYSGNCSDTKTVQIYTSNTPNINLSASSNVICDIGTVTLTANGATNYTWTSSFGNTYTGSSIIVSPSVSTTYSVQGSQGICSSTTKTIEIKVSQITASIQSQDAVMPICNNGAATITPSGGIGSYSYTWTPGNYQTNQVNFLYSVTYTVNVKDQAGCIKQYTIQINCVTGVEELTFLSSLLIYPNPVLDRLFIESNNLSFKLNELDVNMYNSLGQKMSIDKKLIRDDLIGIDIMDLPNGVYVLELKKEGIQTYTKVIKS